MTWCFAIVNGRLAEIFFDQKDEETVFLGHVYVKAEEYPSKKEQKWIKEDTNKHKFSYRKGKYRNKEGMTFDCIDLENLKQEWHSSEELDELFNI